jgi:hypothetical protein
MNTPVICISILLALIAAKQWRQSVRLAKASAGLTEQVRWLRSIRRVDPDKIVGDCYFDRITVDDPDLSQLEQIEREIDLFEVVIDGKSMTAAECIEYFQS